MRRVLVVDDDADSARMLELLIGALGHEVRAALDAGSALAQASEFAPEIVLLDLSLPEMDGFELATRLRAIPGLQEALLVALTGWSDPDAMTRAREVGFDRFLVKPIELTQLEDLLAVADAR